MSEYVKTIGSISQVKGGKRLPKGHDFVNSVTNHPYLRVVDMVNSTIDESDIKYINTSTAKLISTYRISDKDIYVTIAGTIGNFGLIPSKFNNAQLTENAAKLTGIDLTQYDLKYLIYKFSSAEFQSQVWKSIGVGGGVPKLALHRIEKLSFEAPSIKYQNKIASILSTIDAQIEKTEAIIAKYQAIKQGMLHDLFTRGIDVTTGKLRPNYEQAPKLYKPSDIGMIPKEWHIKSLMDLTTQIGDGIHTTPKYSEGTNFYFINGNNLVDGKIAITNSTLCVSEDEYRKYVKRLVKRTILFSINGTIGNIAYYNGEKVVLGKSACYISCKSNINTTYIYFILQSYLVLKFYENELTGSTIKNLSLASVRNTPIPLPSEDEVDAVANKIESIANLIHKEDNSLRKLYQLKQGLMSDLLSGKVSVTVNESEAV